MTRRKMDEKKQTARFGFTCTEAEAKEIRALAEAHGINQHSVFLRLAGLGIIRVDRSKIGTMHQPTPASEDDHELVITRENIQGNLFMNPQVGGQWCQVDDGQPLHGERIPGYSYPKPRVIEVASATAE